MAIAVRTEWYQGKPVTCVEKSGQSNTRIVGIISFDIQSRPGLISESG
jgi:hypothetical protein